MIRDRLTIRTRIMVAACSLFLLCLTASSYHGRHGSSSDVRRHTTPLTNVKSSSSTSGPRRENRKKCFLSAQSPLIEGQIEERVKISTLGLRQLQWEEKYMLLKRFKEREGHCNVVQSHKEDGANLGIWVSHQRVMKKQGKLDPDRRKILEEIGIEWVILSAKWDEIYALLEQYKKREGHCSVPQSHKEDDANLGIWVNDQRQLKRKEKLNPDRQKRLEEIGFEWVLTSSAWDEMYSLLKQFMKREGHCTVPSSHKEDGATLGTWVKDQRVLKRKEKLDTDRERRLEEIGFEWAIFVPWEEILSLLKQFKMREGHCNVPQSHIEDGAKLGAWVDRQRQLRKTGKLDPDRQTRLEGVGEWGGWPRMRRKL